MLTGDSKNITKKGAAIFWLTQCTDIKVSRKENGTLLLQFSQREGDERNTKWEGYWKMVTFEQLRNVKACLQKNDLLKHANLHNFMSLYHFGQQILLHS